MNTPRITILNVDDTPASRYTKTRMLKQAGYTVIEADNGKDALRLAREQLPQLIVLDVRLPDMNGIEVCRRVKEDPLTRSIPVVQISATFVTPHDQLVGLEGGAEIYLTEPIESLELTTAVRVLLRLHSTERGLVQSEARWRRFIESSIVGVIIVSNDRIVEANDAFLKMLGYTRAELLSSAMTWRALTPPESLERSEAARAELRMRGQCAPFEKQYLRKDGSRVWVTMTSAMLMDGEEQWMGFVLDISDRKHAALEREAAYERERAARTEAEEATRLKDEFLANLSHELRTPMNAIIGWTHLLRSGRLDDSQRQRALESIDRGARSQAKLIEDLLDVSRIVSGKLNLQMQPVDLPATIEIAMESQRPAAQAKGVAMEVGPAPADFVVTGDAGRLQQVFLNILSNAVKFTPTGGRVDVRLATEGGFAQLFFADTGEGISPAFLPYVFDRFRQADGTSTRTHMGLGLGLAIVRHVVEMHGGTVRVTSGGEGQGSTFIVSLPLASAESADAPARGSIATRAAGGYGSARSTGVRVLVVEDDPETREIISAILERGGFSYRAATRASEALSVLDEWQPDVIVSDIGMPDMDGYEFARQLRARPPELGGLIPALALTAYARGADREHALRSGYQAHVPKPVDPVDLVKAIAELTADAGGDLIPPASPGPAPHSEP